jgi:hypothetical protein
LIYPLIREQGIHLIEGYLKTRRCTMKKIVAGLVVVVLLSAGIIAYAHGPGMWGGGQMMGPAYGNQMGPGFGGHMMRGGAQGYGPDQEFLNETADQRKELHEKKFVYFEALRDPEVSRETITKLEKEIDALQDKIHEKSPRTASGRAWGRGCW